MRYHHMGVGEIVTQLVPPNTWQYPDDRSQAKLDIDFSSTFAILVD
jgi:hypothetical protein